MGSTAERRVTSRSFPEFSSRGGDHWVVLKWTFFRTGIIVDIFPREGTECWFMEAWKRCQRTPLSWLAQIFKVLPSIPSSPEHLFILIPFNILFTKSSSITALLLFSGNNNCFNSKQICWSFFSTFRCESLPLTVSPLGTKQVVVFSEKIVFWSEVLTLLSDYLNLWTLLHAFMYTHIASAQGPIGL